ncbi:MAG: DUF6515 family protein [Candidatus Omnitrophota bacterium]
MLKQILKCKVTTALCLALVLCSQEAFARGGGGPGPEPRHRGDYYYRGDQLYRHGWLGFDIAVAALTIGAIVDSLPPRYNTVVVGGVPYYYYGNAYYRPCPGGYVVVPPPIATQPIIVASEAVQPVTVVTPVVAAQTQAQTAETVTINIPSSKGGYKAISLKKSGNGFIGPQGEYYYEHPTVEQLKTLYGS